MADKEMRNAVDEVCRKTKTAGEDENCVAVLLRCIIMLFYYMKSHVVPDVNRSAFVCMAYVDTIAEACLRLSLPSVCSVQNERTEYRTYVNT